MKKDLLLKATLLLAMGAVATANANATDGLFDPALAHAPHYTEGCIYENVLGPDMIEYRPWTSGDVTRPQPGIALRYQWIVYHNMGFNLDDGTACVHTSSYQSNYDPNAEDYNYGEGTNWVEITGRNGKGEMPLLCREDEKYLILYVKDTKRMEVLGISVSDVLASAGNHLKIKAEACDGSEILNFTSTPGRIYGMGYADVCNADLNPEQSYKVTIESNNQDILVGNVRLYGTSEVKGKGVKSPTPSYAYWDAIVGPDMVDFGGKKVKTVGEKTDNKFGIKDELTWIEYINPTSTLDDGTAEVQTSNRWTNLDPRQGTFVDGFIQVKDALGNANSPILSAAWGKYMKFQITGTKKFTAYATGSASGSAADGNRLIVEAYPYNSNNVISAASAAGTIYGKGQGSDLVAIDLDENESYEIVVRGDDQVNKDIQLLGITLLNSEGEKNIEEGKGTLNLAIENAIAKGENDVLLDGGGTYTLKGIADVGYASFYIMGNGAKIIVDETGGQIVFRNTLVVNKVELDASRSSVAPFALPDKTALTTEDTLACYTYGTAFGTAESPEAFKYPNASEKVFEANTFGLGNSTVRVSSSFISGGNAPWALQSLYLMANTIEVTQRSGKAIINFEEGAKQIKDINISSSTIYADSVNTNMRFLRYTGQVDPWRVWGYEGENKNLPSLNTITFYNNTFVNVCGDKEFANNIKNTAATTLTFKKNIFVNTWRLQKLGGNLTYSFTNADNVIFGGLNPVDATDASKFATIDSLMGIGYNETTQNFQPGPYSLAAKEKMGDPRWVKDVVYVDPAERLQEMIAEANNLLTSPDANPALAEYTDLQEAKTQGDAILAAETFSPVAAVSQINTIAGAIKIYEDVLANTAISTVAADQSRDSQIYDLTGRRINNATSGLYIQNGKKFLVK